MTLNGSQLRELQQEVFSREFIQNRVQPPQLKNLFPSKNKHRKENNYLVNKTTMKSENDAKIKFEAYLKACQIGNYEVWVIFNDNNLYDLFRRGIRDLPPSARNQNPYPLQRFAHQGIRILVRGFEGQISYTLKPSVNSVVVSSVISVIYLRIYLILSWPS
jgi:hypothetical protein